MQGNFISCPSYLQPVPRQLPLHIGSSTGSLKQRHSLIFSPQSPAGSWISSPCHSSPTRAFRYLAIPSGSCWLLSSLCLPQVLVKLQGHVSIRVLENGSLAPTVLFFSQWSITARSPLVNWTSSSSYSSFSSFFFFVNILSSRQNS